MRSLATARDTVLFTVPRLMPSVAAIFRFGHVLEVPEHDGGPHPLRQPVERAPDDLGHVAFPRVIGYHLIRQFVGRVFVDRRRRHHDMCG